MPEVQKAARKHTTPSVKRLASTKPTRVEKAVVNGTLSNNGAKSAMEDIFAQRLPIDTATAADSAQTPKVPALSRRATRPPPRDGLFRQAEPSVMDLSDEAFFQRGDDKPLGGVALSSRSAVGVSRVVTEAQIKQMTKAKSKRAGTTKNCPFDCDCCF